MNRHAVNDLIECSLHCWYRSVSEWRTPTSGTLAGCVSCRASEFAVFDRRGQWPHDLAHSLVDSLELVCLQLARALHDEHYGMDEGRSSTAPCGSCSAEARSTVQSYAHGHAQDISDVVNECAMPRLAAYVEENTALILSAATRGEWAC